MDPEAFVQGPDDKAHQIRVSRLPYHLVKRQQVARSLEVCPFNARHRIPQAELQRHCCPDQHQLFVSQGMRPPGPQLLFKPPHSDTRDPIVPSVPTEMAVCTGDKAEQPKVSVAWQASPCQEDWEEEMDQLEETAPFIFDTTVSHLPLHRDGTALAAPSSWSQGVGPAAALRPGRLTKGPEQQEQNGPRRVVAQPGWCPPPC